VQAAITNKRFAKGVQGKGGKYQTNAVNLGSQRYGPGVANAQQAYQQGMAPVIAALQSVNPPPRSSAARRRTGAQQRGRDGARRAAVEQVIGTAATSD
jgi:hypothetical protein